MVPITIVDRFEFQISSPAVRVSSFKFQVSLFVVQVIFSHTPNTAEYGKVEGGEVERLPCVGRRPDKLHMPCSKTARVPLDVPRCSK